MRRRSTKEGFRRGLGLLDNVRNYVLRGYDHDLILGEKEFVCSDLRYLLGHEWWKGLQCDIGWYFLANPDLGAAGHLLDMHVLQHDLFNDVVLLGGELDRPRGIGSLSSGGVWAMAPPTKNPAVNAIAKAARFITGPIRSQRSMVSRDNHDRVPLFHGGTKVWRRCCRLDRTTTNETRISMTPVHSNPASVIFRVAALVLTITLFFDGDGNAQSRAAPDSPLSVLLRPIGGRLVLSLLSD